MSKSKKNNNTVNQDEYKPLSFIRKLRIVFVCLIALLMVYGYYLHTEDLLLIELKILLILMGIPLLSIIKSNPIGFSLALLTLVVGYKIGVKRRLSN